MVLSIMDNNGLNLHVWSPVHSIAAQVKFIYRTLGQGFSINYM